MSDTRQSTPHDEEFRAWWYDYRIKHILGGRPSIKRLEEAAREGWNAARKATVYQCPQCGSGVQFDPSAKPCSPQSESREHVALQQFCSASENRGETTSLKEWSDRLKFAYGSAKEVLAGREPYSEPK